MKRSMLRLLAVVSLLLTSLAPLAARQPSEISAVKVSPDIVISQVYGGGGNSGATYTHDFIELFNRGTSSVSINGWSVQYASSSGSTWATTPFTATIPAGGYYLIQQAQGAGGTTPLPTPDASGSIAMSGSNGKVALVNNATALVGSTPSGSQIIDVVGFGSANFFEGTGAAPVLTNSTAAFRLDDGCQDTDNNNADFVAQTTAPRNSATTLNPCTPVGPQPIVPSCGTSPWAVSPGVTASRPILATDVDSDAITATLSVSPTANITLGSVMTSTGRYTGTLTVNNDVPTGDYTATINFSNEDGETASCVITISVAVQPIVPSCGTSPWAVEQGTAANRTITATDADSDAISATLSVSPTANITLGSVITTTGWYTGTLTVNSDVAVGSYTATINFSNEDGQTASCVITINVNAIPAATRIHDIQGAAHISPMLGQAVTNVQGVVTAKKSNGFYFQDEMPDSNPATSEGLFVFTSSAPTALVGDRVSVNGTVSEFRPGGISGGGLTLTQISASNANVTVLSSGNPLPAATVVGNGGRIPPTAIIDNDATGNVETSGTFDATEDGIDFYESLESMVLQVNNPVVVGPTNNFGEFVVLGDNGANAGVRTTRGGINAQANDFNPERIMIDDALISPSPDVDVNDSFTNPIIGVLDYGFGNFKIAFTQAPSGFVDGGLQPETAAVVSTNDEIAIASLNVENLDPSDTTFTQFGAYVVSNLKSPDILAVQEIQDNNGATNDSITDASQTYAELIDAIQAAGGPTYQFTDIAPADDQDGGQPGGNIRVGYLYRTDRGVSFVNRAGGTATNNTTVQTDANGPFLSFSPGRIDPTNSAWSSSRKPLAAEFTFNGERIFIINNHFNSKGGDNPLYGFNQPPVRSSETQRHQQAAIINAFVDSILAVDASASVVVLGDLNDFQFSETLNIVKGGASPVLVDLIETLPVSEQYTYVYEGNSQALDHILVSNALHANNNVEYDVVHVNSEFANQLSDHEPEIVRLTFPAAPTAANYVNSAKSVNTTTINSGGLLTYTITISNAGDLAGTFALTDTLATSLTVVNPGDFTVNGQTLTLSGPIAGHTTITKTFTVQVSSSFVGTINNTASLSGDGSTRSLAAPAVTVNANPTAANFAASTKAVNTTEVKVGELLTYTITINNAGDLAGTYAITDVLDSNLTIYDSGDFTVNGQTLTLNGSIVGHTSVSKSFTVRVGSTPGTIINTATLSGDGTNRTLTASAVTVSRYGLYIPVVLK